VVSNTNEKLRNFMKNSMHYPFNAMKEKNHVFSKDVQKISGYYGIYGAKLKSLKSLCAPLRALSKEH
jgi:hypothetical protein